MASISEMHSHDLTGLASSFRLAPAAAGHPPASRNHALLTDPAASAPPSPPRSLFRDGSFLRLWAIGSVLMATRWFEILATSVFTFAVTDSALAVALVQFARAAPNLLFGAITGAIADWLDRRRLMIGGQLVLTGVSALLWGLAALDVVNPWHIAVGAFINGIVFSTEFPVRRTMMGEMAGIDRVGRAMSLDLTANNATRIIGPAMGGLVYETLGISGIYLVTIGAYATCVILTIGVVQPMRSVGKASRNVFASVAEGLRYVRSQPALMGTMALTVIMNIWGFPYANMVPVMGKTELGLSAFPLSLLLSSEGAGALVGSLLVAGFARRPQFQKIYLYGAFVVVSCVILFSFSRVYELSLAITCVAGFGVAGFTTMQATLPYVLSAPEMRARVMGVLSVCVGSGPIGILNLGLMSEWFGAPAALAIAGVEGLIALVIAVLVWREIR